MQHAFRYCPNCATELQLLALEEDGVLIRARLPERDEIPLPVPIEERLIIEFYS